ncbi:probable phosphoglycerate mutase [Paenibacillus algorifonticola]|uniref:Probable phosphoglycerate mutase n=1 Tax=Paenibacillus algorifonticola TaxID=684063 RepID=A0A1I2ECW6_9BACL|nr:histidine phosphatase family protein [Paenibacillus algorifonticola]SFE90894.1 probable phosphoglycerate mutase [Paenibacillus algorifonticola]
MIIGLVRHGNTDWNKLGKIQGQTDIPLNERGIAQAVALANRLSEDQTPWDAVIASDLQRARETARIIADKLDIPLLAPDERLRERFYGDIEGTTEQERIARWGEQWRHAEVGQESDETVRVRGRSFVEEWRQSNPQGRLLVVTHGSFLAQLLDELCSGLDKQFLDNMSYSILQFKGSVWEPLLYNCSRHLQQLDQVGV